MRFVIVKPGEPHGNTAGLIGVVSVDNVYINTYPKILTGKQPKDLAVDERTRVEYNLSGTKGEYDIARVE